MTTDTGINMQQAKQQPNPQQNPKQQQVNNVTPAQMSGPQRPRRTNFPQGGYQAQGNQQFYPRMPGLPQNPWFCPPPKFLPE